MVDAVVVVVGDIFCFGDNAARTRGSQWCVCKASVREIQGLACKSQNI